MNTEAPLCAFFFWSPIPKRPAVHGNGSVSNWPGKVRGSSPRQVAAAGAPGVNAQLTVSPPS